MFAFSSIADIVSRVITLLIAFTIHELAHALTADYLGDPTPRLRGRITLNPLAHLDPIGTIMLIVARFGWAKPVEVSPWNLRYGPHLGMAIVAAAGPLSNLGLAILGGLPLRFGAPDLAIPGTGSWLPSTNQLLFEFVLINIFLMLFNLLPIAPLDGSKILRGFAPREWDSVLLPLERYGPIILLMLVFVGGGVLSFLINAPALYLLRTITGLRM